MKFAAILENWYEQNGRHDLPWRNVHDPYLIWISEIILQQTRVAQGYEYYQRFICRFPDVFSLAQAREDEVLKQWEGLGYYSRARNLYCAAKRIAEIGYFPTKYEEVRKLKGIGDYTAAAICSFAYQQPYAVVDGNVYRVLSRIFDIHTPIDTSYGKKEFYELANELLDKRHPDIYNSAIMDFGAIQCTPKTPLCNDCPFSEKCLAFLNQNIQVLPKKSKRTTVTDRFLVYVYIEDNEHILLRRRGKGDIWQGLYEPFLIEYPNNPADSEVMEKISNLSKNNGQIKCIVKRVKHLLTHRRLWIDFYTLKIKSVPNIEGYIKIPKDTRENYAVPQIISKLFSLLCE